MKSIVFVSKASTRGGTAYEKSIKTVLAKENISIQQLLLNVNRYKFLVFNQLKYFAQVALFKINDDADILITNTAGVFAGILRKRAKKRVLVFHHYDSKEFKHPMVYKYLGKKFFRSLKKFDRVVVVAEYWKNFLLQYIPAEKISVIQNCFSLAEIELHKKTFSKESFLAKYNIPGNKTLVYAGNALAIKGFARVINMLGNDEKYFIVTSGNKDVEVNHVHLDLDFENYIHLLCAADVTILLSEFLEGWNRIAHESILCKTPVIGTNAGGMGELLEKANQYIYSEGDDLPALIEKSIANKAVTEEAYAYASKFDDSFFETEWRKLLDML